MIEYVQFYPTLKCNATCEFCFNQLLSIREEFPRKNLRFLINWLKQNSIAQLDILGGEPTLYSPLEELIRLARNEGIKVWLSSNGYDMKRLYEIAQQGAMVGISVNSIKDLERVHQHTISQFFLKTVYQRQSEHFWKFFLKLDVKARFLLYPDVITPEQAVYSVDFYSFFSEYKQRFALLGLKAVFCEGFIAQKKTTWRCPAGQTKITLLPDGSIYPCYLLAHKREFCLGNIYENSLREILYSDVLLFFREHSRNTCPKIQCPLHERCKGGCPAHSLIHYGSLSAPEPRCSSL